MAYAVVLQPDGRILAAGGSSVETGGGFFFALACYNSDGSLDPTFGEGGKVVTTVGDSGSARAALIQPDGKIVLAGGSISYTSTIRWDFAIVRFNSNGSLDATFGEGGKVITDFGDSDGALDLAIAPDGRLLAAGASGGLFALACYLNDLDMSVQITSAEVIGKKLYIYGKNFDDGAKVFLNGEKQKTAIDEANPTTVLIGKKAGKKIAPGQTVMLRIKCLDGRLSNEFRFTRPIE